MKNSSDVPLGVLDLKEKWDTGERVSGTDARGVPNSNSTERKPGKIARALITVRFRVLFIYFLFSSRVILLVLC